MHWRLYILFLSATAAFCFMLLTAVTDYGSGARQQTPLVSATMAPSSPSLGVPSLTSLSSVGEQLRPAPAARAVAMDPLLKPLPAHFYVASDADAVQARLDKERLEHASLGKPSHRNRLKWDGHGWHREEVALTTAYCPCSRCCGTHSSGITSTGKDAWQPGLAADPIYLTYGTRVSVPGYGMSVIDDTGGAMRRHWRRDGILHIDVRMTYHYEARQWGKQYLKVKIYEDD